MSVCVKLMELLPKYGNALVDALVYAWTLFVSSNPVVIFGTGKIDRIRDMSNASEIRLDRGIDMLCRTGPKVSRYPNRRSVVY